MFKQNISFEEWGGKNGKYRLLDNDKNPIDKTPEDTCDRVAKTLSDLELPDKREYWYKEFRSILGTRFAGGGRIMANVGAGQYKKETSPINCTVLKQIPDSLCGIMDVAKDAALTLKAGCGVGYDFSTIRPKGSHVFGAGAGTSGVISFMKIFDAICSTILSGGARRGAQMACLDIQSPEIFDFITAKRQDGVLRYFNCSVLVTDRFMQSVEDDKEWSLWFWEKDRSEKAITSKDVCLIKQNDIPYNHPEFEYFQFAEDHCEVEYGNCTKDTIFKKRVFQTVKAKELYDLIMRSTYDFWEPGFLLIDRANIENNLYFSEIFRATNPCVTGDTRLATQYGLIEVKELFDKQLSLKVTVDNRAFDLGFGVSIRDAVPVFKTSENAEIFNVITKHGYEIKATEWHEFYSQNGKVKLKNLKVGDTLYLQSGKGQFGTEGSYELGCILGMIAGDGHISNQRAVLGFWGEDRVLAFDFAKSVNKIIKSLPKKSNNRLYKVAPVHVEKRNYSCIQSEILAKYLNDNFNFNSETKLKVPDVVWKGTEKCVKGYLSALFQADGTFYHNEKKQSCRISLSSSTPVFLKEIQQLLLNFGIVSKFLSRTKSGKKMMPDGKGGQKEYQCKENYELFITKQNILLFMKFVGFLGATKNSKVNKWMKSGSFYSEKFFTTIQEIKFVGYEPVYDTTQNDKNAIILNGIHSGNCGEQFLAGNASCLLGSMILTSYVLDPFFLHIDNFDWKQFGSDIRTASRFLDNVVEVNNLPLKKMQEQILAKRRHGLGFTGLGSALNMLCFAYGSSDSLKFAEKISLTIAQESLVANIELAKEKGCAPIFATQEARKAVLESVYLKRLIDSCENKEQIIKDILEFGLRYSHATCVAPTGTMSITWGNNCSGGIEPEIADSYFRNIRNPNKKTKTQEEVMSYSYFMWKQKNGNKPLPDYWRTVKDLSIMDHLRMQAIVQKWVDSSISKTINIPADYPFEDFKKIYLEGWKLGLKGVTTYRPNASIGAGVLTQKSDLDATTYTFILEDGREVSFLGSEMVEYDGETHNVANLYDALKEGIYGNM